MELETKQLVMAVRQIAEEKNLPEEVVKDVIEQALAAAYRKDFGDKEQEVRSVIDIKNGDVTVFITKDIVKEVVDEHVDITLSDAQVIRKNAAIGETIEVMAKPETFGRVAAQTAKQVILQKLREAEREIILSEYQDKIGTVLSGIVQRVESRLVRIDLGKASGILPMSEQIMGEHYSSGNRVKVFLKEVEATARGPQLILSRATPEFIEFLFQSEVPEMENGAVEIKAIAREAGVRTKLAVASSVPGVDPVGTFVGGHGTRVQAVMGEIGDNEKIDIITFDEDTATFITNALSPTEVSKVELDEDNKKAVVRVADDQLSVAIGKNGQNVRLASKLSGYEIDIESLASSPEVADKEPEAESEAPATKQAEPVKASVASRPKRKSELEESLLTAIDTHGEDSVASEDGDGKDSEETTEETA